MHCEKIYHARKEALLDLGQGIFLLNIPDVSDHLGKIHDSLRSNDLDGILMAEKYFKIFMTKLVLTVSKKMSLLEVNFLRETDFYNINIEKI